MGEQNQQRYLVVMTNSDVYYLTKTAARELMARIGQADSLPFFETVDVKSGNSIAIALKNVSSVVIPEGFKSFGGRHA
ncbi:hypothetical protein BH23PAT2_BH23PAT2_08210 [soil metagenome]